MPRPTPPCPACDRPLLRSRRSGVERLVSGHRRWRCTAAACGWAGLLPRRRPAQSAAALQTTDTPHAPAPVAAVGTDAGSSPGRAARRWGRYGLLLATGALLATAATAWLLRPAPPRAVMVGPHVVNLGTHLEGERLPPDHPLHRLLPAQALEHEPAGYTAAGDALLRVRRHCAWGLPGRNPYRGSPEQALQAATLSPTVVRRIAADIRAGRRTDRVQIDNAVIRATGSGREFNPQRVAMTYGMTLCVDTRVNFVAGHSEGGDLYEAMDDDGRIYAVMVPDVCGNVSVLGQRYVRETVPAGTGSAAADPRPWLRLPPEQRIRELPRGLRFIERDRPDGEDPPEGGRVDTPGSLALSLLALAALGLARRRRAAPPA